MKRAFRQRMGCTWCRSFRADPRLLGEVNNGWKIPLQYTNESLAGSWVLFGCMSCQYSRSHAMYLSFTCTTLEASRAEIPAHKLFFIKSVCGVSADQEIVCQQLALQLVLVAQHQCRQVH